MLLSIQGHATKAKCNRASLCACSLACMLFLITLCEKERGKTRVLYIIVSTLILLSESVFMAVVVLENSEKLLSEHRNDDSHDYYQLSLIRGLTEI